MIERWVQTYRANHLAAAKWARGSHTVHHSFETQCRVFRMAEQLRVNHIETSAGLFSLLRALDAVVDSETIENVRPSPLSAAAAGVTGYKTLFGRFPPLQDLDWPEGFERVDTGEAVLAGLGLQALGFDPIMIDGIDPAAYIWALFEMGERQEACEEVIRLHQHPALPPRCLAIIPEQPIRRSLNQAFPIEHSRESVGARR